MAQGRLADAVERAGEEPIEGFITYSRADAAFANRLGLGLASSGFAPDIDRRAIAACEN
jgi:hypothetical protein